MSNNTPDNEANDIEKGPFKRNQVGYSFGGPIVKDKVHFFSSLEYIGVRGTDTLITWVPTPEFLAASNPATRAYFDVYGKGVTINGPTLTRADVSAIIGTGAGAFNSLPANLPIFGRVDQPLAIETGGGFPQDDYQLIEKVDFSLGQNMQASVRYAYQNQDDGTWHAIGQPVPVVQHGRDGQESQYQRVGDACLGPRFTSQSKVVWNRVENLQPVNGEAQPRLVMNPTGPVRLQGNRIAFPGYLPFNPGSDIPFGGPQKLFQFYQDQTWLKGNHDLRFGGSYVHIADDRTFSAYSNAVEALNTTNNALISLNNFVLGQILRFQAAINPGGYPGGTFVTPVQFPSFTSFNRYNEYALYAQDNWSLGDRRQVESWRALRVFRAAAEERAEIRLQFLLGDPDLESEHGHAAGGPRLGPHRQRDAVEREPGRSAVEAGPEQLRARGSGSRGT